MSPERAWAVNMLSNVLDYNTEIVSQDQVDSIVNLVSTLIQDQPEWDHGRPWSRGLSWWAGPRGQVHPPSVLWGPWLAVPDLKHSMQTFWRWWASMDLLHMPPSVLEAYQPAFRYEEISKVNDKWEKKYQKIFICSPDYQCFGQSQAGRIALKAFFKGL